MATANQSSKPDTRGAVRGALSQIHAAIDMPLSDEQRNTLNTAIAEINAHAARKSRQQQQACQE